MLPSLIIGFVAGGLSTITYAKRLAGRNVEEHSRQQKIIEHQIKLKTQLEADFLKAKSVMWHSNICWKCGGVLGERIGVKQCNACAYVP